MPPAGYWLLAAIGLMTAGCASPESRRAAALMEAPIAPSSDAIFGAVVYTNGQLAASPQTDADWERLAQHASRLESAAVELKALAPADDPGRWVTQADALARAARDTQQAIAGQSLDGVLIGGGRIYDTCTSCHATYAMQD